FMDFRRKIIAKVDLRKYEKKLNVKTTYDYEKRKEMLVRWANVTNSKWLEDEDLKSTVFETIKDESNLPTPLNIKDFIIATVNATDEQKLLKILKAKSIETAKGFAQEIKNVTDDKILFLSFPFIFGYIQLDFVRTKYQELAKELDIY